MCKLLYQQQGAPAATRQGSRLLESDVPSVKGQAANGLTMFLRLELLMYVQYTVEAKSTSEVVLVNGYLPVH